jgi:MSHA pilin protein MshA
MRSAKLKSGQAGFTLIELVVVIVILGILAAFAVPRFARLDGQARIASVRALEGSLRSASAMTHGLWLASGNNPANVNMEGAGGAIAMTVAGYPAAIDTGIRRTLAEGTISNVAGRFTTATPIVNQMEFRLNGAPNGGAACLVRYTAPMAANGSPVIAAVVGACQ